MSSNQPLPSSLQAIRGSFLDFVDDPFYAPEEDCVRYVADGLLVLESGRIKAFGPYADLEERYAHRNTKRLYLVTPGNDTAVVVTKHGDRLIVQLRSK